MSTPRHPTTRQAYLAFDIGKNLHWLGAYGGPGLQPLTPPQAVRANQAGFETAAAILTGLLTSGCFDRVIMGHEPTGVYHEAWARALFARFAEYLNGQAQPQLTYLFVNPYQTKQARQCRLGRNRKTDALDLPAIAQCLAEGAGAPAYLPDAETLPFAQWAAVWRQATRDQRRLTIRLLSELDQLWPGALVDVARFRNAHPDLEPPIPLVLSKPLERALIQALLQHCPNPHRIRAMSETELVDFLREHCGRGGPVNARRVLAWAQQALLPPPDITAILARRVQADFAQYQALAARLETLKADAEHLALNSPASVLTTVPGISPFLAARYLAGVGHAQRFASAAQVWAFAGFDPLSDDSGDARRAGQISGRGDPAFRDTLYLIGLHTSRNCPPIARAKQRAQRRGMGKVGAVIHAAHKANRLCWRLLYDQTTYDPACHR